MCKQPIDTNRDIVGCRATTYLQSFVLTLDEIQQESKVHPILSKIIQVIQFEKFEQI